jgi:hypothetical protein
MTISVNKAALRHAHSLIKAGAFVADERDDWSDHAPSTRKQNAFIKSHDIEEFGTWHLGEDGGEPDGTKQRFSFPFGDFAKVHRCAVISLESRAAQYHHREVARAAKELLAAIDSANGSAP